jgi:hydrogenase expression/formation protein HypE
VILSGSIGDHGVAVMSKRSSLGFETEILSDSAALHGLVADMVAAAGPSLRLLRDPPAAASPPPSTRSPSSRGVDF